MLDELILVTNAASHIGSHIIKQLLQNGYLVRGVLSRQDAASSSASLRALVELCTERRDRLELVEIGGLAVKHAQQYDISTCRLLVSGCGYVIHVASTEPLEGPTDPVDKWIEICRQSTLNVLQACQEDGRVEKVVLTGSCLAVHDLFKVAKTRTELIQQQQTATSVIGADVDETRIGTVEVYDESSWTDAMMRSATTLGQSKVSMERAAWDYVHSLHKTVRFSLTTILPSLVLGPVLHRGQQVGLGKTITKYLIHRTLNFLPVANLMLPVCDVRDVALAHVRALEMRESDGMRVLISTRTVGLADLAENVQRVLEPLNYNVNAKRSSSLMARVSLMLGSGDLKRLGSADLLHRSIVYDNTRMRTVFKFEPILEDKSIVDMADSLIQRGDIELTERYAAVMSSKPEANYFQQHDLGSVMAGDDDAGTYMKNNNGKTKTTTNKNAAALEVRELEQPTDERVTPKPRKKWFSGESSNENNRRRGFDIIKTEQVTTTTVVVNGNHRPMSATNQYVNDDSSVIPA